MPQIKITVISKEGEPVIGEVFGRIDDATLWLDRLKALLMEGREDDDAD